MCPLYEQETCIQNLALILGSLGGGVKTFKIGDRVRYLRELSSNKPRVPSDGVGQVIRIHNGWVWVRFVSPAAGCGTAGFTDHDS